MGNRGWHSLYKYVLDILKGIHLIVFLAILLQVHQILLSIYDMAYRTRCQTTSKQQQDLAKPLHSMEHLIIQNCNRKSLVRMTF